MNLKLKNGIFLFLLSFFTACASFQAAPDYKQAESGEIQKIRPAEAYGIYGRVLQKFVDEKGWVHFQEMEKELSDLSVFLNWIAQVGPATRPDWFSEKSEKLAYYINSYNALSMYNVIKSNFPSSLDGMKKLSFFILNTFKIDGKSMSLYRYENDVIRALKEERVHFALNCSSKGCPRLPRTPFLPNQINEELEREARYFFSEERNLKIDHTRKVIRLSEILSFYRGDFPSEKAGLIAYINRYRDQGSELPSQYEIEFIPYDWTVVNLDRTMN